MLHSITLSSDFSTHFSLSLSLASFNHSVILLFYPPLSIPLSQIHWDSLIFLRSNCLLYAYLLFPPYLISLPICVILSLSLSLHLSLTPAPHLTLKILDAIVRSKSFLIVCPRPFQNLHHNYCLNLSSTSRP